MCFTVFNLYNTDNNNYNKNCLFDILLKQLFAILLTTEIFKPRLFCAQATSHKTDWILTDSLPVLPWRFIVQNEMSNERSWTFYRDHFFPFSLMFIIIDLLGLCYTSVFVSVYFVCIVILLLSLSFRSGYLSPSHPWPLFLQILLIVFLWNVISSFPFV